MGGFRILALLCVVWQATSCLANIFGNDPRVILSIRTSSLKAIGVVTQMSSRNRMLESCTGSLVGSRLVLTAAHCVGLRDGALDPQTKTLFLPSVVEGRPPLGTEASRAIEVWTGGWRKETDSRAGDWAILLLDHAPRSQEIRDFGYLPVSPGGLSPWRMIASVGYSSDISDGDSPSADLGCRIRAVLSDGAIQHDCAVFAGASGGPILARIPGHPDFEILGIHNAHKSLGTSGLRLAGYRSDRANLGTSAMNFLPTLARIRARYSETVVAGVR